MGKNLLLNIFMWKLFVLKYFHLVRQSTEMFNNELIWWSKICCLTHYDSCIRVAIDFIYTKTRTQVSAYQIAVVFWGTLFILTHQLVAFISNLHQLFKCKQASGLKITKQTVLSLFHPVFSFQFVGVAIVHHDVGKDTYPHSQ